MPELKSLLMLLAVAVVGAGATLYVKNQISVEPEAAPLLVVIATSTNTIQPGTSTDSTPDTPPTNPATTSPKPPVTPSIGIAPNLTGKLTEVNTGCFSDGECSAMVGGKKVVLLIGRYQGKVGKILGADSIGDLENYIGAEATVFAGKDNDGNFTLLGNESFYIQVSSTSKPVAGSCVVGGCSSQLCGESSAMDDMVTTCEYKEEYACYKKATCARQSTGSCGWTETAELNQCLKNS
jgi:hypothetical protein